MEDSAMDRYRVPATLAWPGDLVDQLDASVYRDRCIGSLLAGALGDELGSLVEGWPRERVLDRYGPAGVTDLPAEGTHWTDDTQLTALVGQSLVATGGRFDPDDVVRRLVDWLPTGRGVGRATRKAVHLLAQGRRWDEVGPEIDSSGNGAAMRTAPVGLVHALDPAPSELLTDAVRFALPTHGGEIGVAGAVAMAAGVGYLIRRAAAGATTFDPLEFIDFLVASIAHIETSPTPTRRPPETLVYLRDRLREVPGWLDRDPADVFDESWTGAFALESVPAAMYAFLRSPGDPRAVLVTGANASHDTDTIAAMAGNLVGAWLGAEALAAALPEWWDRIERRDELAGLAGRLATLGWAGPPHKPTRVGPGGMPPADSATMPAAGSPESAPEPLERREYDAPTLMRLRAPVLRNPNKQVVFGIACPDRTAGGHISYSRWAEMPLSASVDPSRAAGLLAVRDGFFDYLPVADAAAVEWHLNFADPNLFYAYGSALFAQDEMQVAEHPALASLREALVAEGRSTRTVAAGRPTPVLVMGAERRVRIETDRRAERGGPSWLYGIAFAEAAAEVVREATIAIDPPTISNLIAIAAPFGGHGRYRHEQIELALSTAHSGFRAAVLESRRAASPDARVIVHSGFWGCGAFGGNRVLMTLLQLLAAEMAGLYLLVLHIGEPSGRASVQLAMAILRETLAAGGSMDTAELVSRIEAMGLEWGHGDGN
jgi:ADP-ribosylglycohydrolase